MSIKPSALFAVGDQVQIKTGASAWMKAHNYWISDWPESIDGLTGTILHDYTQYAENDCHYEVAIEGVNGCGVHPQWLTPNDKLSGGEAVRSDALFGASVVRADGFRSNPLVNSDEDMMRVTLDMPKHTWRKLQKRLPPNNTNQRTMHKNKDTQ